MLTSVEGTLRGERGGAIAREAIERLEAELHGRLLQPSHSEYDAARRVWNAMIDRRPALIARCADAEDVACCVRFARERDVLLAVRGGGHNIAGSAVCDGGLVIDLSELRSVTVDASARRAAVAPGATLADVDRATQAFGLVTPLGINSTTGVAGLTLGGGLGWLTRKFGYTVDNLLAAEIVSAEGRTLKASAEENPDLFWAIRGGGGNFGVVTQFDFQLHALGPDLLSGLVVYSLAEASQVLGHYRRWIEHLPDELSVWLVLRKAPPLPFLPATAHGEPVLVLALLYAGEPEVGRRALAPMRTFGTPLGEHVGVQPFAAWQQAFDPLLAPGMRNYWKSHNLSQLSEGAIEVMLAHAAQLPTPDTEIFVGLLGGYAARIDRSATAYPHHDTKLVMNVHGRWESPSEDRKCIDWCRALFQSMAPHATGGAYVNFLTEDERERIPDAYGENYARLMAVKAKYDPDNIFRSNQNIRPGA